MANLRTPVEKISLAMKARSEGLGLRATGRILGVAANSVVKWEKHLSAALSNWSPPAPTEREITIEGDEVYTRVGENLPPRSKSRMDNPFCRTENPLLDRGTSGIKEF